MITPSLESLGRVYAEVRYRVIEAGYANEIVWQDSQSVENINESEFLTEYAWVVLASGMREQVVRKLFVGFSEAFHSFTSAELIVRDNTCVSRALNYFNHSGKVSAIAETAQRIFIEGFDAIKNRVLAEGPLYLQTFGYMGPATSCHLAKNLGLDLAKPDRHLERITSALGYANCQSLCGKIAEYVGERASVVDLVLWRYATLNPKYICDIVGLASHSSRSGFSWKPCAEQCF